jgi:hypothetical protein
VILRGKPSLYVFALQIDNGAIVARRGDVRRRLIGDGGKAAKKLAEYSGAGDDQSYLLAT